MYDRHHRGFAMNFTSKQYLRRKTFELQEAIKMSIGIWNTNQVRQYDLLHQSPEIGHRGVMHRTIGKNNVELWQTVPENLRSR